MTEISHASIQTTPMLTNSIKVGGSGPAFIDTTEKGVQRQVIMTETSCQQDRGIALSAMKSFATSTEQLKTADFGTGPDREIALSAMKSFATSTEQLKTADFGTEPDREIALSSMQSFATSTERLVTTDSKTGPDAALTQWSVGCQKAFVSASNIHHTTQTDVKPLNSISTMAGCPTQGFNDQGVGRDFELKFDEIGVQTIQNEHVATSCQTLEKVVHSTSTMVGSATINLNDKGVGRDTELVFNEEGVQTVSAELNTTSSQTEQKILSSASTMVGCPAADLVDTATGHEIVYNDSDTQTMSVSLNTVQSQTDEKPVSSTGIQVEPLQADFNCGNGIANLGMTDKSIDCVLLFQPQCHVSTATEMRETRDSGVQISPVHVSVAIGDGDINEPIWCDRCSARTTSDIAVGMYDNDIQCCIDDKLCDCVKPEMVSKSVSDHTVTDTFCDRCDNLQTTDIGVGDSQTMTLVWCDKCTNMHTTDACVGCETLETQSVAIGDNDVTIDPSKCDECEKRKRDSSYFNFDFNMGASSSCSNCNGCQQQQPIICHYCGNKVDLNDDSVDETLQAMRDSMQSLSGRGKQSSELKRSGARKNLNLDLNDDEARYVSFVIL